MTKVVDYYFTPISPWTYLGHQRFEAIARRHGAEIRYKPVDYFKVFPASGGLPLAKRAPQRQHYRNFELERWRKFLNVELNMKPKHFPTADALAAKLILACGESGASPGNLAGALMRAVWAEERDIADRATLMEIAGRCKLDGAKLLALAETPGINALFEKLTDEAILRQVFGAPTYIYREEPFWGQDRLDFLDRALAG
ncbi:MAG TPA: 2-hydroxychromene-2-carboxylate isomerase [Stellaceae bacterium]|nr:2-hydroxychromene-2-carboxylate isomerase [Stellaceae bacterium]